MTDSELLDGLELWLTMPFRRKFSIYSSRTLRATEQLDGSFKFNFSGSHGTTLREAIEKHLNGAGTWLQEEMQAKMVVTLTPVEQEARDAYTSTTQV